LKNTSVELVYLSCCRSSAAQAATELARNSIRTTIGFRWDLDDVKAVAFAELFYQALLGNRLNVCSAIREARDKLHNKYDAGDPIWASPVLLAQPQDWRHVEGVLRPPVRP
jgi:CHAT domain-containing protein